MMVSDAHAWPRTRAVASRVDSPVAAHTSTRTQWLPAFEAPRVPLYPCDPCTYHCVLPDGRWYGSCRSGVGYRSQSTCRYDGDLDPGRRSGTCGRWPECSGPSSPSIDSGVGLGVEPPPPPAWPAQDLAPPSGG